MAPCANVDGRSDGRIRGRRSQRSRIARDPPRVPGLRAVPDGGGAAARRGRRLPALPRHPATRPARQPEPSAVLLHRRPAAAAARLRAAVPGLALGRTHLSGQPVHRPGAAGSPWHVGDQRRGADHPGGGAGDPAGADPDGAAGAAHAASLAPVAGAVRLGGGAATVVDGGGIPARRLRRLHAAAGDCRGGGGAGADRARRGDAVHRGRSTSSSTTRTCGRRSRRAACA